MDVRIGVTHAPKELNLEIDGTPEEVAQQVETAMGANGGFLWLTDRRGTRVGVPLDKLAYLEIEGVDHDRHVGFNT